jgi:hypothetical protein
MSVSTLTQVETTHRPLRTYAFLTACREQSQSEDALDCILPFVIAGIRQQRPDFQLDEERVLVFLRSIGLDLPATVLTHLKSRLRERGILKDFNGADVILPPGPAETAPTVDLGTSLDEVDRSLQEFAIKHFNAIVPPVSKTWSEALIGVLKSETTLAQIPQNVQAALHKADIVSDSVAFERVIIGRFVEQAAKRSADSSVYDTILQVFSGIKIEDFIRDIQTFSMATRVVSLQVYYDTSVLLRMLGLSGELLKSATTRMHRALVKLGCKTKFFPVTKVEVKAILERVVRNPQDAQHPETSDAYRRGELKQADLRDLDLRFADRLYKEFGIAEFSFARTREIKRWSLVERDQKRLAGLLEADATSWNDASIRNDVSAVSDVLALRRGEVTDDITEAGHLFISVNPLLQRAAKTFCQQFLQYYGGKKSQNIPPVLLVGQMASLAWLTTEQEVERKEEISQELLVTCFNAVRPSREWITRFEQVFEEYKSQDPAVVSKLASGAILMRTIRGFVQDASLNQPRRIEDRTLRQAIEDAEEQYAAEKAKHAAQQATLAVQHAELAAKEAALTAENKAMGAELKALRQALEEREERERNERERLEREREGEARAEQERLRLEHERADQARVAAEQLAQAQRGAAQQDHVVAKSLFLVLVLVLLGLDIFFARQAQWLFLGVPFLLVGTPMLFGLVFYGHRFQAADWLTVYEKGLVAIPLIGRALAAPINRVTLQSPQQTRKAPRTATKL